MARVFLLIFTILAFSTLNCALAQTKSSSLTPLNLENIGPIIFSDGTYGLQLSFRASLPLADESSFNDSSIKERLDKHLEDLCIAHGSKLLSFARTKFSGIDFKVFAIAIIWVKHPAIDAISPVKLDTGWRGAFKIKDGQCGTRL